MHRVAAATLVILCICNTNRKKKKVVLSLNVARNWNVRWQVTWYSFICYLGAFSFSSIILSLSLSLFLYMYIYIYIYIGICVLLYYSRLKFFCEIYQTFALEQILFITVIVVFSSWNLYNRIPMIVISDLYLILNITLLDYINYYSAFIMLK